MNPTLALYFVGPCRCCRRVVPLMDLPPALKLETEAREQLLELHAPLCQWRDLVMAQTAPRLTDAWVAA